MGHKRPRRRRGRGGGEPRPGAFKYRDHGPLLSAPGRDSAQGRAEAVGEGNHAVRDSVTQTLITSQYGTVTGVKTGNVVQINVVWKSANAASWGTGVFGTIPEGWRPVADVRGTWSGRDGGSQREFLLKTDGTFTYANRGGSQSGDFFATTMTYIVA